MKLSADDCRRMYDYRLPRQDHDRCADCAFGRGGVDGAATCLLLDIEIPDARVSVCPAHKEDDEPVSEPPPEPTREVRRGIVVATYKRPTIRFDDEGGDCS